MAGRARDRRAPPRPPKHPSAGTYVLKCRIEEHGPGAFLAVVTALPDGDCEPGARPESESRMHESRADAFRACAEMGFAMEERLLRRGLQVRGWPPRPRPE